MIDAEEDCNLGSIGAGTWISATGGALPVGQVHCAAGCTFDTSGCTASVVVGGATWFLGADGASCDSTCTDQSLTYDSATSTYAGSGGTDQNCAADADAFGFTVNGGATSTSFGLGCFAVPSSGSVFVRDTTPTVSGLGFPTVLRFCACQ